MPELTDRQLVSWAVANGWRYFHSNDQLRDPNGGLTTAGRWNDIGEHRRQQILSQMSAEERSKAAEITD